MGVLVTCKNEEDSFKEWDITEKSILRPNVRSTTTHAVHYMIESLNLIAGSLFLSTIPMSH